MIKRNSVELTVALMMHLFLSNNLCTSFVPGHLPFSLFLFHTCHFNYNALILNELIISIHKCLRMTEWKSPFSTLNIDLAF